MLSVQTRKPPEQVSDVYVHVEKETDAGIYVSGAKVVATGSVLTNYTFIAHHGLIPLGDKKFALVFMTPTNAEGIKFISRTSYEMTSTVMSSPFDHPLRTGASLWSATARTPIDRRADPAGGSGGLPSSPLATAGGGPGHRR